MRSETAPSAMGIEPTLPPLNRFVRRLLALSSRFLLDFGLSDLIDWHLIEEIRLGQEVRKWKIGEVRVNLE